VGFHDIEMRNAEAGPSPMAHLAVTLFYRDIVEALIPEVSLRDLLRLVVQSTHEIAYVVCYFTGLCQARMSNDPSTMCTHRVGAAENPREGQRYARINVSSHVAQDLRYAIGTRPDSRDSSSSCWLSA
jgi:hypothetical protein